MGMKLGSGDCLETFQLLAPILPLDKTPSMFGVQAMVLGITSIAIDKFLERLGVFQEMPFLFPEKPSP